MQNRLAVKGDTLLVLIKRGAPFLPMRRGHLLGRIACTRRKAGTWGTQFALFYAFFFFFFFPLSAIAVVTLITLQESSPKTW